MLETCVADGDLIIESREEVANVKSDTITRVGIAMEDTAVSRAGLSGLSIVRIAECYPENLRFRSFGIRMIKKDRKLTCCSLRPSENLLTRRERSIRSGQDVADIDVFERHDCFTSFEYVAISSFGLT